MEKKNETKAKSKELKLTERQVEDFTKLAELQKDGEEKFGYKVPPKGVYHVIVKVFPGGERYRTYLVDPRNEDFCIMAVYDRLA
jgi:hypothetical protein